MRLISCVEYSYMQNILLAEYSEIWLTFGQNILLGEYSKIWLTFWVEYSSWQNTLRFGWHLGRIFQLAEYSCTQNILLAEYSKIRLISWVEYSANRILWNTAETMRRIFLPLEYSASRIPCSADTWSRIFYLRKIPRLIKCSGSEWPNIIIVQK
jgi:hypothetical protein